MDFLELPRLYGKLKADLLGVAGMAVQVMEWDRTHQYCSFCGTRTALREEDRARQCPDCGARYYPRVTPAVIVLISRGKELLLARSPRFPPGAYCLVAGFVEPGETVEEAAEREVREEVGVSIKDLRYFGSQPWPFPHTLMLGFTAKYAGGEVVVNHEEIEDARWFPVEKLPPLPSKIGLSKRIIAHFVESLD